MISKEAIMRKFITAYDLAVPPERLEEEYELFVAQLNHQLVYSQMAGRPLLDPGEAQEGRLRLLEECRRDAWLSVKEELVIKAVIAEQGFEATMEERIRLSETIAVKQGTPIGLIRQFFGEDLALLDNDIKRQKAEDWIVAQSQARE